jgi:hypothetical protein
MEYYSAIKKNGIMSFARKWIELEIIIPHFRLFVEPRPKMMMGHECERGNQWKEKGKGKDIKV